MYSAFAVPLILTFVLTTSTCYGVRLANYIPTLQEYPAGRDDLIESYFHLERIRGTAKALYILGSH